MERKMILVKLVNKGRPRERYIDKWSLFGGYFVLFYHRRVIVSVAFIYRMVFIQVWPVIQV